jgi:hypothetical protein
VFEYEAKRRMSEPKRDKLIEEWIKLHTDNPNECILQLILQDD